MRPQVGDYKIANRNPDRSASLDLSARRVHENQGEVDELRDEKKALFSVREEEVRSSVSRHGLFPDDTIAAMHLLSLSCNCPREYKITSVLIYLILATGSSLYHLIFILIDPFFFLYSQLLTFRDAAARMHVRSQPHHFLSLSQPVSISVSLSISISPSHIDHSFIYIRTA